MKTTYGTSPTKEGIVAVISQFWYRKDIELVILPHAKKEIYIIKLGDNYAEGWQVIKQGGRYRFVEVEESK